MPSSRFSDHSTIKLNIDSRPRSYGFITYLNEADAIKAVETLDKSEIDGRQINVEIAKPPTAATPRAPRPAQELVLGEDGEPIKRAPRKNNRAVRPSFLIVPVACSSYRALRQRKAAAAARRPRTDGETEEQGDAPTEQLTAAFNNARIDDAPTNGDAPRAPRTKKPRAPRVDAEGNPLPPRRIGPPTGTPSTTLVFVANLPFSVNDESLAAVFEGYQTVSARVVVKKFGLGSGRSKGFGFVDFASEAEQQRALGQSFEIEGREIALKVAINPEEPVEEVVGA